MSIENNEIDVKELYARWNDLTSFVSVAVKDKWWDRIRNNYASRPFHNLFQLSAQLKLFDEFKDQLKDRYAVAFAIFFKHLEYNINAISEVETPNKCDENELNVRCLHEFCSETTFDQENYVANLLAQGSNNCTEAHLKSDEFGTDDIHYLIDFDTAWLGAKPIEYDRFSSQIRQESPTTDDNEYRAQRLKVLQLFLQVPNIFATREFRERFENQARENIQREIDALHRC